MKCPICEKDALFVGVHDDEGNYHGLVGCDYESNPWSGLSYALHHEGWGECPLCTDGEYSPMGGMLFDTAEEAITSLTPPNEPLMQSENEKLRAELEQVKRERDAAISDLTYIARTYPVDLCDDLVCQYCKHHPNANTGCPGWTENDCFEWRGQKED